MDNWEMIRDVRSSARLPRGPAWNGQTGMWFMQWLLRLTEESEGLQGHRFTSGSYSGSYGSLEIRNTSNGHTYTMLMYSGSRGSIRTQKDKNYPNLLVVHIVALMAQWGSQRSLTDQPTCLLCLIHIVAPVAHWGPGTHKLARCTWRWYVIARGLTGDAECPQIVRSTYG